MKVVPSSNLRFSKRSHTSSLSFFALLAGALLLQTSGFSEESRYANTPAISRSGKVYQWNHIKADDFGALPITYQSPPGLREISKVPAPGIHPRIFFGPDEVQGIYQNLQKTQAGQELWLNALAWIHAVKGTYDRSADYATPNREWYGYRVPLIRLGLGKRIENQGAIWKRLIEDEPPAVGESAVKVNGIHWAVFALESFRCLMQGDEEAGRQACLVVERALRLGKTQRAMRWAEYESKGQKPPRPNQEGPLDGKPYSPIGGIQLAYCYDFLYNWMTPEQRNLIREELAFATHYFAHYGTFLPAEAVTSNWCTLDGFHTIELLAIQGENGYNAHKYQGTLRAWKNFLTYGWYPSGEGLEGRGKNYQFNNLHIAFARQGDNLFHHPHVLPYAEKLMLHTLQPYGESFFGHGLWGGTDRPQDYNYTDKRNPGIGRWRHQFNDVIALKWAFPENRRIDYVYRHWVREDYSGLPRRPDGRYNDLLTGLMFASDYLPDNHPDDFAKDELTFFCPHRGLLITRSSWDEDALMLSMHSRQDLGGHVFADRNSFLLTAKGRIWTPYHSHAFSSFTHSMVTIDGEEQSHAIPSRVVDFVDSPNATLMTGDASYSWAWKFKQNRPGKRSRPVLETANDFYYQDIKIPYYDLPFAEQANWLFPETKKGLKKVRHFPEVKKAFRTAGIVRGAYPFALVIDDIQIDSQTRNYTWAMQLAMDVGIAETTDNGVILAGGLEKEETTRDTPLKEKEPLLMVHIINTDPETDAKNVHISHEHFFQSKLDQEKPKGENNFTKKTLLIPSSSSSPDYKVLLYPYLHGEPIPEITYHAKTNQAEVKFPGQTYRIHFHAGDSGKTNLQITNLESNEVVELNRPVEPFPNRDAVGDNKIRIAWDKMVNQAKEKLGDFDPNQLGDRIDFSLADLALGEAGVICDGVNENGIKFTGGEEGISLPKGIVPQNDQPFTVSFWAVADKIGGSIMTNPGSFLRNGNSRNLHLYMEQSRAITVDIGGSWRFSQMSNRFYEWHHVTISYSGKGEAAFYFDGQPIKEGKLRQPIRVEDETLIGGEKFSGRISDLRIFKRALSPEEVSKQVWYDAFIAGSLSEDRALLLLTQPGHDHLF